MIRSKRPQSAARPSAGSKTGATWQARSEEEGDPRVRLDTALGRIVLQVFTRQAPLTAQNFLRYVDGHHLDGSSIYRIVTPDNQHPTPPVGASVVQWGMRLGETAPRPFPPVAHEPTSVTGLTHCDGAVSLARFAAGTGSSEFFFCIGDQPQLDFGGIRNPDGLGFAVFGRVVSGQAALSRAYARAEADHLLSRPIRIRRVSRLAAGD